MLKDVASLHVHVCMHRVPDRWCHAHGWDNNLKISCRLSHPRDPPAPIRKNYFPIGTVVRIDPGRMGSSELQRCCVDLFFHSSHIYGPISGLPVRIFQIGCAVVFARCDSYPYGSPHSVIPTSADSTSRPILAL